MQEVTMENLIHGREYWMEGFTLNAEEQLVSHNPIYRRIAKYDVTLETNYGLTVAKFTNFRDIKFKDSKDRGYTVTLDYHFWKFYEILEKKVQRDMENRAYNIVIRQKVPDEYFEYRAF